MLLLLFSHSVWLFVTPWTAAQQVSMSFTISRSLLKLMSTESVMPSNHLILCCPLLFLPSIFPSIRVLSNESTLCLRWPKYWSFSISRSNEYSVLFHPPGMWDPSSPNPCPLQWKCGVLTTGPPGKSWVVIFNPWGSFKKGVVLLPHSWTILYFVLKCPQTGFIDSKSTQ